MPDKDVNEWWSKALLNQEESSHPVFGSGIKVKFDDGVVTLKGAVKTVDDAEAVAEEASRAPGVSGVINHLNVDELPEIFHLQTVVAVFPDKQSADLACRVAESWTFSDKDEPKIVETKAQVKKTLGPAVNRAEAGASALDRYLREIDDGKVLFVERVPEDDALRVISELEGMPAERVLTLPPEPGSKANDG